MAQESDKIGKAAGQRYDREAEEFAKTDKGEKAAQDAKRAVDSDEAKELREAERRGRGPARK